MSTRAIYSFTDEHGTHNVYKHCDGYPTGAAEFIRKALPYAWPLPRFEADEFACAFIAANKRLGAGFSQGGDLRTLPTGRAQDVAPIDIAFRYEISAKDEMLNIVAFSTNYWRGPTQKLLFSGTLDAFANWATEEENA